MALEENSGDHCHPLGPLIFKPKFRAIHPITCLDISLKMTNVNLIVTLDEKLRDHKSQLYPSYGDHKCLYIIIQRSSSVTVHPSVCSWSLSPDGPANAANVNHPTMQLNCKSAERHVPLV